MKFFSARTFFATVFTCCAITAAALSSSAFSTESILGTGRWVRVKTDTTGIYQITAAQLKEWGFADPSKVGVYGYGAIHGTSHSFRGTLPDGPTPAPMLHTSDGRILFFAEGDVRVRAKDYASYFSHDYSRNYYDFNGTYFLTDSRPAADIREENAESNGNEPLSHHTAVALVEDEIFNPTCGGVFFHGKNVRPGEEIRIPFSLENFIADESLPGTAYFDIARFANTAFDLGITTSDNISLADETKTSQRIAAATSGIYNISPFNITFTGRQGTAAEAAWLTFTVPADADIDYLALEKAVILYPQTIAAPKANESFVNCGAIAEGTPVSIQGAVPTSTAVWNISDICSARAYTVTSGDNGTAACTVTGAASNTYTRLVIFDKTAQHRAVKYAGEVSCANLHAMATPDMVIITLPYLHDAAEELADIHRTYQKLDVAVVDQQDIFDEFSSGVRHPAAIHRFMKMLYDRAPQKLHYLLLYGPANLDHRGITNPDPDRYIVTFEAEQLSQARYKTSCFASDQYFGMLSDSFSATNIATREPVMLSIGRIPSESPEQARLANAKILNRFKNPMPARKYLCGTQFSDWGDNGDHMKQAQKDVNAILAISPYFTMSRIDAPFFHDPNNKNEKDISGKMPGATALIRNMDGGIGLFNYCGHGNPTQLGGTVFFNAKNAAGLRNKYLPVALLASCDLFPYDYTASNFSEEFFFNPDGGAIAVIAADRTVYLNYNMTISNALSRAYASAKPSDCTGDMLRIARATMLSECNSSLGSSLGNNTLAYNLCGDPAVPLGAPEYSITVESVNGVAADGEITAQACRPTTISGAVTDGDGNVVDSFNGAAVIDVYDIPTVYNTRDEYKPDPTPTADENLMASFTAKVTGGRFTASFVMPEPSGEGEHRIVVTATDKATGAEGAGGIKGLKITSGDGCGYAQDIDTSAPRVLDLYVNSPSFTSGGTCAPSFTVTAIIDPSQTGISAQSKQVITASRAYFDTEPVAGFLAMLEPQEDGTLRADIRYTDVSCGHHTFTVRLVNHAGERSEARIDFNVMAESRCILACDAPEIADGTADAVFTVDNREENVRSTVIRIADASGRIVRSANVSGGTFSWDFTDNDGNRVADGLYKAWVMYEAEFIRGSSMPVTIVFIGAAQ